MHAETSQIAPSPYPYRVHVLAAATPRPEGIAHLVDGSEQLIEWSWVSGAFAAEVGEPEGVRTIVFDLVFSPAPVSGPAPGLDVYRLDADPGEDAMAAARTIQLALGSKCNSPGIKSVAVDGIPSRWYPDLESFQAAALEALRRP